jgi:hypothetical protein
LVDSIHTKGESDNTLGMTVAVSQISLATCDWIVEMAPIRQRRMQRIFSDDRFVISRAAIVLTK